MAKDDYIVECLAEANFGKQLFMHLSLHVNVLQINRILWRKESETKSWKFLVRELMSEVNNDSMVLES